MSQVDIYQYAEVIKSDGTKIKIGSKQKPSTITLTGTGEIVHHVFNDIAGGDTVDLYTADLTGLKFFAVKSSLAAYVGFSENSSLGEGASIIGIGAGVWQFFGGGLTGADPGTFNVRMTVAATTPENITIVKIHVPGAVAADVEFIGVY